jgi:hypothetical protein
MRLEELERLAARLRDACRQVSMDPRNVRKREQLLQMLAYAGHPLFGGAIVGRSPTINEQVDQASAQAQIVRQRLATSRRLGPFNSFVASQAATAAGSLARMLGILLNEIRQRPPDER